MAVSATLDRTFAALGDTTRRAILGRLSKGETALSELATPFQMSQTAVSKHVRTLSEAGLVRVTKRGRTRYCSLDPGPLKAANEWLTAYQVFWDEKLSDLASFLEEDE